MSCQLQRALQTRIGIEQAKGIICESKSIPMDATFELLRAYARNHNLRLHDVARDIVTGALAANDLN